MSPARMREGFQGLLAQAREMHDSVLPQIQARANTLDAGSLLRLIRDPAAVQEPDSW